MYLVIWLNAEDSQKFRLRGKISTILFGKPKKLKNNIRMYFLPTS
jgi:hypothetical protein